MSELLQVWLDATVEQAAVGMAQVGLDGTFLRVNARFCQILGREREVVCGLSIREITHPDDLALDEEQIAQLLAGTSATYTIEKRYLRQDGTSIWVEVTRNLARDAEGRPLYFITVTSDVSRRKRAEEELAVARRKADEVRRLEVLGRVAGGIAHDFNNLLVGIRGGISAALETGLEGSPAGDALFKVTTLCDRAAELAHQLLTFGRRQPVSQRKLDPHSMLQELVSLLPQIVGPKVVVRFLPAPESTPVLVDPAQLERVVINLALNARDAMPGGQGTITIRTTYRELLAPLPTPDLRPGRHLVLSVEDDGCGIDEQTLRKVFDPLFTTKPTGTGLGLSTAHGIVRSHGGSIVIESEPGHGTRVNVYLPVTTRPTLSGCVLVVEQDAQVRSAITRTLSRAGVEVLGTSDFGEAATLFAQHRRRVSLLVAPLSLGRETGPELHARLAATREAELGAIFMASIEETVDTGWPVLRKPFHPDELLSAAREVLARVAEGPSAAAP